MCVCVNVYTVYGSGCVLGACDFFLGKGFRKGSMSSFDAEVVARSLFNYFEVDEQIYFFRKFK